MIGSLVGALLSAAPVAGADPDVACAFERARALAAGEQAPEAIADQVVAACTAAAGDGAAVDDMRCFRLREAALAIVYRSRGIDKLPADAPIRLPEARTLDIADEIAPAVIPYVLCLKASDGVPVYENGRRLKPPKGVAPGDDCSGARAKAAADAETMLRRLGGRSAAQRRAFIATALADIDAFTSASAPSVSNENDENDAED
ncbi:MAG: hypothetical protein ACK40O_09925 [Allosphingosinicella sp.]